jgi:hypothetical protein
VPGDSTTIQGGINGASTGDTVMVAPGAYVENIDFIGKSITVVSEDGPDSTTIDGNAAGRVVTFQSGEDSTTVLDGFTITNGNANNGGGILCNNASPTITNNVITGNYSSDAGGGIFSGFGSASLRIVSNLITDNEAMTHGGGIFCNTPFATIENNVILHNHSVWFGGGIHCSTTAMIINNIIAWNSTSTTYNTVGGGIFCSIPGDEPPPTITNNTLFGNFSCIGGGIRIYNNYPIPMKITNTICWNNSALYSDDEISYYGSGDLIVSYCDVRGGYPGVGNIDANPYFHSPVGDNFRIAFESPCRDAGDSTAAGLPEEDFEGDSRILFDTVDIGADEVDLDLPQRILLVPSEYPTIQAAIDSAFPLDTVLVASGTYFENIDFRSKVIAVLSESGAASTIIDGNAAGSVVTFQSGEDSATVLDGFTITNGNASEGGGVYCNGSSPTLSNNIITANSGTWGGGILTSYSSPTVTNCTFSGNSSSNNGGGMFNGGTSSPTVTDCIFSNNSSNYGGGGMFNGTSSPMIVNCTFSGNSAPVYGGGMYNYSSSPMVISCSFSGNSAANSGGGMYNDDYSSPMLVSCIFSENSTSSEDGGGMSNHDYSSPALIDCIFFENSSSRHGGGMHNDYYSSPTVTNCTFSGNSITVMGQGGGMLNERWSDPIVTNCTFSENSSPQTGGGMYNSSNCNPIVINCTFSRNSAGWGWGGGMHNGVFCSPTVTSSIFWEDIGGEISNDATANSIVTYSCVQGGYGGTGNIDEDPLFVDPENGDYHVDICSPMINAGDPDYFPPGETDIDGEDRVMNGRVDMGVDEVEIIDTNDNDIDDSCEGILIFKDSVDSLHTIDLGDINP